MRPLLPKTTVGTDATNLLRQSGPPTNIETRPTEKLRQPPAPQTTADKRSNVGNVDTAGIPSTLVEFFQKNDFSSVLTALSQGGHVAMSRDYHVGGGPDALPVRVDMRLADAIGGLSKAQLQALRKVVTGALPTDVRKAVQRHPASEGPATAEKVMALISGEASALAGAKFSPAAKTAATAIVDANSTAIDKADRELWIGRLALAQATGGDPLSERTDQLLPLFEALKRGHLSMSWENRGLGSALLEATVGVQERVVGSSISHVKDARAKFEANPTDPTLRPAYDKSVEDAIAAMKQVATPDPPRSYGGWTLAFVEPLLAAVTFSHELKILRNELGREPPLVHRVRDPEMAAQVGKLANANGGYTLDGKVIDKESATKLQVIRGFEDKNGVEHQVWRNVTSSEDNATRVRTEDGIGSPLTSLSLRWAP